MLKNFKTSIANILLRAAALGSKSLLIVYISKYLSTANLGVFSLFSTTITIASLIIGLDFYTFNTRELLAQPKNSRRALIRDQFVFHLLAYALALPFFYLVFIFDIIPIQFLVVFYLILVFEHISQECIRLFTVFSMSIFANFIFFIKAGLWIYLLFAFNYFDHSIMVLESVFFFWVLGVLLAMIIAIGALLRLDIGSIKGIPINWEWIKTGIRTCLPFFVGTVAYKVIDFSDRYLIDIYMTPDDVGIYSLFYNIANLMNVSIFALVVMVGYPKLIQCYNEGDKELFKAQVRVFAQQICLFAVLAIGALLALIHPLLNFIGKAEFLSHVDVFYLLLAANFAFNLSLIPHYILYAQKQDRVIMYATLFGALVNITLNIILITKIGIYGAAIATIISFLAINLLKYGYARNH